jgi:hypothetical protein
MISYLPFVKIRKILFSKNLYGKWLILFDILIKECICNFLPRDLHENVFFLKKNILVKRHQCKIKSKINQVLIKNSENSYAG